MAVVVKPIHRLRCLSGNISAQYTQTMAPQEAAKLAQNTMTQTMIIFGATVLSEASPPNEVFENAELPVAPMMIDAIVMPNAPHINSAVLPHRSARIIAGNVATTFTPVMSIWKRTGAKPAAAKMRGPKYIKAFMPQSCDSNANAMPKAASFATRPSKSSVHKGSPKILTASTEATISWNSSSASASESRKLFKTSRASSKCPLFTSQRGDRGRHNMPRSNALAGTSCTRMARRQPFSPSTSIQFRNEAVKMPTVIIS
mmetsp:Transcript_78766/g.148610  ORF Transcript_78766/g.148610 Transcript_78766/m.148610 type:complete len:258 (+) Transcript_78766:265-1038(+)